MATAIRIKLVDLLAVLAETSPEIKQRPCHNFTQLKLTRSQLARFSPKQERRMQQNPKPCRPANQAHKIDEGELRAIQKYLKNSAASRRDLEFHFNMTSGSVMRRLKLLKERGIVEHLPGNVYALTEALQ